MAITEASFGPYLTPSWPKSGIVQVRAGINRKGRIRRRKRGILGEKK
jgi:hypothetical protein